MTDQAIARIDRELKAYKGDQKGNAMKDYVAGVLRDFCRQNGEFAQAVVQGGSFDDCMKKVVGRVKGQYISDLDACKAAAEFYFPGSVVEFNMVIRMSSFEAQEQTESFIPLRLEDLL